MRPAFSVVFLTTLIGAAQGLLLAVFAAQAMEMRAGVRFFVAGSAIVLVLAGLGLVASFFHLGRPERAWRTAAKWRTSWLSREVIALPAFMAAVAAYGYAHYSGAEWSATAGLAAAVAACVLFVCTAMIYACIKFLQEWASPYTLANFVLMGCASGATLAVPLAAIHARHLAWFYAVAAVALTLAAMLVRLASLARNERIVHKSTPQSAIGIDNPRVVQKSQGFTASSFNTREFFHGLTADGMRRIRAIFIPLAFVVPAVLVLVGMKIQSVHVLAGAFAVQYAGLIAERWFFLAQASHPQNLYYQSRA
jgi:DMSO reductase anchor subunit